MAIPITKERLLLVEGPDEELFFSELLKCEQVDNIQVLSLEGKDNLTSDKFIDIHLMTSLKSRNVDIKAVGVVVDCDSGNVGDCINKVNTFVEKVNRHKPKGNEADIITFDKIKKCNQFTSKHTPISLYVMPDCNSNGSLETLCMRAVKYNDFMPCVEEFINCIKIKNPGISHEDKRKYLAYLASASKSCECKQTRIGRGIEAGLFDLDSTIFQDVKNFIRQMSMV